MQSISVSEGGRRGESLPWQAKYKKRATFTLYLGYSILLVLSRVLLFCVLRFMMQTMDLEVPLLHIRTPIGNRWQESTMYSWIRCEMQSKSYLRERSSNRCCPGFCVNSLMPHASKNKRHEPYFFTHVVTVALSFPKSWRTGNYTGDWPSGWQQKHLWSKHCL